MTNFKHGNSAKLARAKQLIEGRIINRRNTPNKEEKKKEEKRKKGSK